MMIRCTRVRVRMVVVVVVSLVARLVVDPAYEEGPLAFQVVVIEVVPNKKMPDQ